MCSPCGLPQGFNHKDAATKHHSQVGSYFICITLITMFAVIEDDEVVDYFEDETEAYNEYLSCIEFGETKSLYVVKLIEKYEETNED